jgi:adenosylmethionine-8-amino-7-oxononanoate aminotransferase
MGEAVSSRHAEISKRAMPKKPAWLTQDLRHNWHPYTQMQIHDKYPPLLIERAKGLKLYDADGNYYYDTISSWWCNVHGHNHPKINAAIQKQLAKFEHVMFAGFTHQPAIELSETLLKIAPRNLSRVFYSDDGSTAVETALKMSFQYWQNTGQKEKTRFVALDAGYHGDTVGAMSVSGIDLFNEVFSPLFFKSFKVPTPNCYRCPAGYYKNGGGKNQAAHPGKQGALSLPPLQRAQEKPCCRLECLKTLETLLKHKNHEIAAVILEPLVMAAGGMIIYPKEYLIAATRLAKKYNVHLIVDEVATGFGRTGKMFAVGHAGASVRPDFMCLSKGLTTGYLPMGATLTTEKIYRAFLGEPGGRKTFYHGHTFTANPVACAAALASLKIFEEEKTLARAQKTIAAFHKALEDFRDLPYVGDVRALGMIGAVELVKDKSTKERFAPKDNYRIMQEIYRAGLKEHLVLRPLGNIIYFWLPLGIAEKALDFILSAARACLSGRLK